MNSYEKFIKLLKEGIDELNSNQCQQSEETEYDPDIRFDLLISNSEQRIKWIKEFHNEFNHDIEERHVILLAENLVEILEIIDYRKQFTIER